MDAAAVETNLLHGTNNNLPDTMIFLTAAAAFGIVGLVAIIRDRYIAAIHDFLWCFALLVSYYLYPHFPS